jgi:hypothetical protein
MSVKEFTSETIPMTYLEQKTLLNLPLENPDLPFLWETGLKWILSFIEANKRKILDSRLVLGPINIRTSRHANKLNLLWAYFMIKKLKRYTVKWIDL